MTQTMWRRSVLLLSGVLLGIGLATPARAQYFGQNKVQYDRFDFRVLATEHFDIYYYPAEAEAAQQVARMAERWHERLGRLVGHQLSGRQAVVLYASHPEFEQTNVIEGMIDEATGGVTEGLRRRVVLPLAGSLAETDHVLGHELVHAYQYDILGRNAGAIPLWFIEGMAEYFSIGPTHAHTAMWLRDALLADALPDFSDLNDPRYFPYRFGHAFWAYIGGRYGDEMVGAILRSLAAGDQSGYSPVDPIGAIEANTQTDRKTLITAWHDAIRGLYELAPRPKDAESIKPGPGQPVLLAERAGGSAYNVGPSLSPDGTRIAFLSERSRLSIDLYVADTSTGEVVKRLTKTSVDPHFQSLQFLQSAGAWSPDGRRLAVATVQSGRPVISIFDVNEGDVVQEIPFEQGGEVFQPTWSPDSQTLAFSAQVGGLTDLFTYDFGSGTFQQLTKDAYADLQPAWAPDGRRLVFVTDRHTTDLGTLATGDYGLALIEPASRQISRVTTGLQGNTTSPQWSRDGDSLYFVSDHSGRPEVYRVGLSEQRAGRITSEVTGVSGITPLSPALSVARTSGRAAFSVFREGGYEVHLFDTTTQQAEPVSDLPVVNLAALPPATRTETSLVQQVLSRPTAGLPTTTTFETQDYKPNLSLLAVGQQLGASTGGAFGTYVSGGVGLLFSDLLGNHLVSTGVGVEGGVKDISAQLSYINRTRRWNWGVFGERVPLLSGSIQAGTGVTGGQPVYIEQTELLRQTYTQAGALIAYPFSRAFRVEATVAGRRIGFDRELQTRVFDAFTGSFLFEETEDLDSQPGINLFDLTAALVRDTSAFGAVGPIAGQRFRLEAGPTFGDLEMVNVTADFRQYSQPFGAISFAARGLHAGRYGGSGEDQRLMPLFLGYSTLVRGYDVNSFESSECTLTADGSCPEFDRLIGSRILVFNGEVRAPLVGLFTGNLDYGPIPAELFGFFDSGVAWTRSLRPSFANGTRDWVSSAGFGLRANALGYAIVELNMARPLNREGRGWMFVFNLRPSF